MKGDMGEAGGHFGPSVFRGVRRGLGWGTLGSKKSSGFFCLKMEGSGWGLGEKRSISWYWWWVWGMVSGRVITSEVVRDLQDPHDDDRRRREIFSFNRLWFSIVERERERREICLNFEGDGGGLGWNIYKETGIGNKSLSLVTFEKEKKKR